MKINLYSLLVHMDSKTGQVSDIMALVRAIKVEEDLAWDTAAVEQSRCTPLGDTNAAYQRGRAHALCEVLGDQAGLFALIDVIETPTCDHCGPEV